MPETERVIGARDPSSSSSSMKARAWVGSWLACLGIAGGLFSLARLAFYLANRVRLPELSAFEVLRAFAGGLRFDLSSLLWVNAPFLLSHLLPHPWKDRRLYRRLQKTIFLVPNGLALALELIDAAYYPWALRRSGPGDLAMVATVKSIVPGLILEFWWLVLVFAALVFAASRLYDRAARGFGMRPGLAAQLGIALVALPLAAVGTRGGMQMRPIAPNAAAQYVGDPRLAPLVANTTLNWIFAVGQYRLEDPGYMDEAERAALAPLLRTPSGAPPRGRNAVVIVMESLDKAHVGHFREQPDEEEPPDEGESYTPFLDSLFREGLTFTQTYANGLRSSEGIPAVGAGVPALLPEAWIYSPYQSNLLDAAPRLLAARGFHTAFFHGGTPGTMAFDRFAPSVGFARYADRDAFGDDRHYDGSWGIRDIPFFEWTADELLEAEEPFFAMLFSLSSHHPYEVPPDFEAAHPDLAPRQRSVLYADTALRRFFEKVRAAPWYRDTLFVVTADHTARRERERGRVGVFEVPIVFVAGDGSLGGLREGVLQQIDIGPTVLDWLGYDADYYAFGRSAFDESSPRYGVMMLDGVYQILDGERLLLHDGAGAIGLYAYGAASGRRQDLRAAEPERAAALTRRLEAILQTHHQGMLTNRLSADTAGAAGTADSADTADTADRRGRLRD